MSRPNSCYYLLDKLEMMNGSCMSVSHLACLRVILHVCESPCMSVSSCMHACESSCMSLTLERLGWGLWVLTGWPRKNVPLPGTQKVRHFVFRNYTSVGPQTLAQYSWGLFAAKVSGLTRVHELAFRCLAGQFLRCDFSQPTPFPYSF